jgi:SIR2-like domain
MLIPDELLKDETFLHLARRILGNKCVLFVGAGASISSGAPSSQELAKIISTQILLTDETFDLADAVTYADAMTSRKEVVGLIGDTLRALQPSEPILALTVFPWISIYTTNFDDLIEKAYETTPDTRAPALRVYDPGVGFLRLPSGTIPLYMLHGSYKRPLDHHLPLILTQDDISNATPQLTALYRRLTDELAGNEIVYIGFSLRDTDFRDTIAAVWRSVDNQSNLVPRGYAILPSMHSFAEKHWDTKKITLIPTTIEAFIEGLRRLRSGKETEQPLAIGATPALPAFLRSVRLDSTLAEDLVSAFDFPELASGNSDPALFFRGGPASWATIRDGHDAPRNVTDYILDSILVDSSEDQQPDSAATHFCLLTGPAGTGKTTLMQRLAYTLSDVWAKPVAWLNDFPYLQFDLIEDLVTVSKQRVYVFVDNAADAGAQLVNVIRRCRGRRLLVSFIASERENEWYAATRSNPLDPKRQFALGRITENEARAVLSKLEGAGELGSWRASMRMSAWLDL